mmetsp:Transcript_113628/g.321759  ORF Transcript_113628/g.321759 Transcript_113628/m.321759 type:complete len:146 (-) Transcript_113628:27-464(-)|eukprot:CAMPEP_0179256654 /NCGR_PEP_ID=MMETSP0797-20121207/24380_1 /TAXON_ID=47934 /ORGANISM="Dinophysis acuminata, Strain DAEP01" /LENGTH=145 /DNA_ID=CAMNT_0020964599 /DNA_START=70 /DNA_END=507 /DNA_ORIENTATION=-
MAAEPSAKNVCHEMTVWKQHCANELKSAATWEQHWGFLKGASQQKAGNLGEGQGETPRRSATPLDPTTLATAGRSMLQTPRGTTEVRPKHTKAVVTGVDWKQKTPRERYGRQITTSHEIGWRHSFERFGVSHHGIKRDPALWPET